MKKKEIFVSLLYDLLVSIFKLERPNRKESIHLMFCIADHFEPGTAKVSPEIARKRVDTWVKRYPLLSSKHSDSDGKCPQYTWFFPPHYHEHGHLPKLVKLCKEGFGEIELHLHHEYDTSNELKEKIIRYVNNYSRLGIFGNLNGEKKYGFIHGNWALDNSRNGKWCGVNNELQILNETGCYADFTFPCMNEAQPWKVNSIYYAKDEPEKPKSYNTGIDVNVGRHETGDLMIIQGSFGLRWKDRKRKYLPSIERDEIDCTNLPTKGRVDYWVRKGIHVIGKPNWIFVKVHTHGALEENAEILLGEHMENMYSYLESKYKDGKKYNLHYVTAREMYNIIKAAEAGEEGNPGAYRDYLITPPKYKSQ